MTFQQQQQVLQLGSIGHKVKNIEIGLDFIINHFDPTILYFPRKVMTKKLNRQELVYSKKEVLQYFQQSEFLDCRINAFCYSSNSAEKWNSDLIFIDIDRINNFKDDKSFENVLSSTLKNIKEKLNGYPTVLFTGGGYHIYQPVYCPTALENITEFQEFDRPSEQFLRFAKDCLSNGKADKNNNPSFKSCLLRIPGSINSKYNSKIKIVKKWNGSRAPITIDFLEEFRTWLIQKKIDQQKQREKILNKKSKNNYDPKYYPWIEHLIQTQIEDFRKLVIDIILAPYLINVRKLSFEESYSIIKNWFDKCYNPNKSDNYRNFEYRINYALKNAINKGIPPMTKEKIKTDPTYSELYQLLQQKGAL